MLDAVLVWFRRDLRLADHPALARACQSHDRLLLVYVDDDADGPFDASRAWLRLSLGKLGDDIRARGGELHLLAGDPEILIPALAVAAGATEVHVRSASPMVKWPCFYGIDTANQDQLIAANMTLEEIRDFIGPDSLGFLSTEGLLACVPEGGYCTACFTGEYPVEIPRAFYEEKFLPGYEPNKREPSSPGSQMSLEELLEQD